jgi:hypothetical protein
MDQTLRTLACVGLGAGLMYLLDPVRGRRRRAIARDQFIRLAHEARDAADVAARDAANRARGAWAEARSAVAEEAPDDRTLTARVRSRLGRCVSHPRAVAVTADHGRVTLSGPILAREVEGLLACVAGVPSVRAVDDRLEVHQEAGNHPSLQGGVPRTGARGELFQENWSPTLRVLAGTAGLGLMGNCLAQRDLVSCLLGTVGFGLFLRAATNTSAAEAVRRTIPAPPAEGGTGLLAVAAAGPVL